MEPEFEEIGGVRFSLPREVAKEPGGVGRSLLPVIIAVLAAFLGISALVVRQTEQGNFLPMQIFGFCILAVPMLPVLALPFFNRKKSPKGKPYSPPGHFPANAIYCEVSARSSDKAGKSAKGWLWTVDDLLRFRGDAFDFDLRARAFPKGLDPKRMESQIGVRILTPKPIPTQTLAIHPLVEHQGRPNYDPDGIIHLKGILDTLRRAPISDAPMLYPPLRVTMPSIPVGRITRGVAIASAAFGLFGLAILFMFPNYLPNGWLFVMLVVAYPWVFALVLPQIHYTRKARNAAVDKLKSTGRLEMR